MMGIISTKEEPVKEPKKIRSEKTVKYMKEYYKKYYLEHKDDIKKKVKQYDDAHSEDYKIKYNKIKYNKTKVLIKEGSGRPKLYTEEELRERIRESKRNYEKRHAEDHKGTCEVCCKEYKNLQHHLISKRHNDKQNKINAEHI